METINYTPRGVCSQKMEIDVEDGVIQAVRVMGGCNGNLKGIASLMVEELKPALMEKGIRFDCQEEALQKIAKEAFGHKSGARDIRKLIRKEIEDPICVLLASGEAPALMMAVLEEGKVTLKTA